MRKESRETYESGSEDAESVECTDALHDFTDVGLGSSPLESRRVFFSAPRLPLGVSSMNDDPHSSSSSKSVLVNVNGEDGSGGEYEGSAYLPCGGAGI